MLTETSSPSVIGPTPDGVPVRNPGFVPVEADGLAKLENGEGYVRLDVPREWLLVKSLLTSRDVDVEWMFCAKEIEALLEGQVH